ncbi:[FeFe] hydrogenase H-cluster maturation GTPase HydF [Veillonella sp. R32]|uniref:[FeFe] hydrogenase H-cluster maturation GTPase HydF n=1 Tax=Veillonella sp. R32 TaxID=2021312 RepID=UPI0013896E75|nr:[FeFe] hydrogenase H-cluster maturation GTPase HydF [Veillonella sp. R32]KAF1678745.1 [FeFe] hydrogenase H-cluster maturation GTPase HydF [Veillonella sp. R32]
MEQTPKANRVHIGFFGRCNAGKSTLINMLTGQPIALVSDVAGTTTDPVSKAMEILPLGPVVITDTAGVDDTSQLGPLRIGKTKDLLPRMNLAVYVLKTEAAPTKEDITWLSLLQQQKIATLLVLNEVGSVTGDAYMAANASVLERFALPYIGANLLNNAKQSTILNQLGAMRPKDQEEEHSLLAGLVEPQDVIVLVCPIDSAAPKGRLILPQVQMIREILDAHGMSLVVQTDEVASSLAKLGVTPKLVITDSQAFEAVAAQVPADIPLTSFSILMARFKGDLKTLAAGVKAVKNLKSGAKVLISEGCTHHRQCDDIGSVKIPRWLKQAGYENLDLQWTSGGAFPDDVRSFDLIIHCGACMLTRREVLRRLEVSQEQGVPIVNYGVLIASLHGILDRALSPFAAELQ